MASSDRSPSACRYSIRLHLLLAATDGDALQQRRNGRGQWAAGSTSTRSVPPAAPGGSGPPAPSRLPDSVLRMLSTNACASGRLDRLIDMRRLSRSMLSVSLSSTMVSGLGSKVRFSSRSGGRVDHFARSHHRLVQQRHETASRRNGHARPCSGPDRPSAGQGCRPACASEATQTQPQNSQPKNRFISYAKNRKN